MCVWFVDDRVVCVSSNYRAVGHLRTDPRGSRDECRERRGSPQYPEANGVRVSCTVKRTSSSPCEHLCVVTKTKVCIWTENNCWVRNRKWVSLLLGPLRKGPTSELPLENGRALPLNYCRRRLRNGATEMNITNKNCPWKLTFQMIGSLEWSWPFTLPFTSSVSGMVVIIILIIVWLSEHLNRNEMNASRCVKIDVNSAAESTLKVLKVLWRYLDRSCFSEMGAWSMSFAVPLGRTYSVDPQLGKPILPSFFVRAFECLNDGMSHP